MLLDIPMEVRSRRLVLRCYHAGDGSILHAAAVRNGSHLARFESGNILLSADTEERGEILAQELHARWVAREAFFAGAFLRESGAFVGQVYLGPVDWGTPEFEIGYIADCEHEGQGYVTEAVQAMLGLAFGQLGAHRVSLRTDETNIRSQHVAQRCGFTLREHLRQVRVSPTGPVSDEAVYGLLREEYRSEKP